MSDFFNRIATSSYRHARSVLQTIGVDTKLKFSLEPAQGENGFEQWKDAMRAVARLPDGMPLQFRKKLWLILANNYIQTLGIDWEEVKIAVFSDRLNPDDDKLGLQIIKDLHRTGFSGLSGEGERIFLKRILLAYARYNKVIGYCQGFNIIAALILEVMEYHEENVLKVMIMLIEHVLPMGYFDQTLRALSIDMAVLRQLMQQRLPKLSAQLALLQQSSESEYEPPLTNVFTMQWFLTLFATCLPKETVFRVWDTLILEGSEVLLRSAMAIWAKIGKRVSKATSADHFYGLMGPICQELLQMNADQSNNLIQMIYSMADFPYPGLAELREQLTWNIQPLSSTFGVLKTQVQQILHSQSSDSEYLSSTSSDEAQASSAGRKYGVCENSQDDASSSSTPEKKLITATEDLSLLQKQYKANVALKVQQRQEQASVILMNAYSKAKKQVAMHIHSSLLKPSISTPVFNHLYMDHCHRKDIQAMHTIGAAIPISSVAVQPGGVKKEKLNMKLSSASKTSNTSSSTLKCSGRSISPIVGLKDENDNDSSAGFQTPDITTPLLLSPEGSPTAAAHNRAAHEDHHVDDELIRFDFDAKEEVSGKVTEPPTERKRIFSSLRDISSVAKPQYELHKRTRSFSCPPVIRCAVMPRSVVRKPETTSLRKDLGSEAAAFDSKSCQRLREVLPREQAGGIVSQLSSSKRQSFSSSSSGSMDKPGSGGRQPVAIANSCAPGLKTITRRVSRTSVSDSSPPFQATAIPTSTIMPASTKKKSGDLLEKSMKIIDRAVQQSEAKAKSGYNPFPVQHQSKVMQHGKKFGLYSK